MKNKWKDAERKRTWSLVRALERDGAAPQRRKTTEESHQPGGDVRREASLGQSAGWVWRGAAPVAGMRFRRNPPSVTGEPSALQGSVSHEEEGRSQRANRSETLASEVVPPAHSGPMGGREGSKAGDK